MVGRLTFAAARPRRQCVPYRRPTIRSDRLHWITERSEAPVYLLRLIPSLHPSYSPLDRALHPPDHRAGTPAPGPTSPARRCHIPSAGRATDTVTPPPASVEGQRSEVSRHPADIWRPVTSLLRPAAAVQTDGVRPRKTRAVATTGVKCSRPVGSDRGGVPGLWVLAGRSGRQIRAGVECPGL